MSISSVHRNRVIYQSEALFVSPDATGYHYTGIGGYGLATPPMSNVDPGQGTFPDGRVHGWHPKTHGLAEWPEWNPSGPSYGKCNEEATFAHLGPNFEVESENATAKVTLVTDEPTDGDGGGGLGEITLTQTDGLAGNPLLSINALVTAHNTLVTTAGPNFDPSLVIGAPDLANGREMVLPANASITLEGGRAALPLDGTVALPDPAGGGAPDLVIPITAQGPGVWQRNANLVFNGDSLYDAIVNFNTAGAAAGAGPESQIDITPFEAAPGVANALGNTVFPAQSSIEFLNNSFSGNDATDPAAPVAVNPGGLQAGDDGAQATFDMDDVVVTNLKEMIELAADVAGSAGNAKIVGNGVDNLDALVLAYNNANAGAPEKQISVVDTTHAEAGLVIMDDGFEVELVGGTDPAACNHGSIIKQLKRIQTVNYGFTVNRQDINQFGHLSRLDSIVIEAPTVNLDFSYYLLDGWNERQLEFSTDGVTNCLSGALSPELYQAGNNFFLLTVPEARDATKGDATIDKDPRVDNRAKSVISIGNGFLTDYSVDLSVGSIPTVSCTVEGMNIQTEYDQTGLNLPAVDMIDGSKISDAWKFDSDGHRQSYDGGCTGLFSLPATKSGYTGCEDVAALRPSDIWIDVKGQGLISKQVSGAHDEPQLGTAHIQSASINIPMARTTLQRLGSTFGFSKAVDVPITTTLNVSAIMSEIQDGNLMDLLCNCQETEITISIHDPECSACEMKTGAPAMRFIFKGARLDSENFSSSIGDNKTVDLSFSVQAGGADDLAKGLYISGKESNEIREGSVTPANPMGVPNNGVPPGWTGTDNRVNIPVDTNVGTEVNKLDRRMAGALGSMNNPIILGYRA